MCSMLLRKTNKHQQMCETLTMVTCIASFGRSVKAPPNKNHYNSILFLISAKNCI